MNITEVSYSIAVPARKRDVALWLLTGGKFGKLFVRDTIKAKKFHAELDNRTHINCRCSTIVGVVSVDSQVKRIWNDPPKGQST